MIWIGLLGTAQLPKIVSGHRSRSDFWKQVFQDGDLDQTLGSKCSRTVIWIGLLEAGQLPKIVPRQRSGSNFWEQVFQHVDLDQTFWEQVFQDGNLDWLFGNRAASKDSVRAAIWIRLLEAGVSEW